MGMRKFKKEVKKHVLKFPVEMYTDLIGSIVLTSYILNEEKPSVAFIKKKWSKFKAIAGDYTFKDKENFINEVLEMFSMPAIPEGMSAFVQSEFNCLVAPYIDGKVLPLREDGFRARTLYTGKVYSIKEGGKKDVVAC